jgi:hypothetical protein
MTVGAGLRAWIREVFASPETAPELERAFPGVAGAVPIGTTTDRRPARVAGVIRSIAIGPRGRSAMFEAELADSTGVLRAVWLGQRQILGLEPGRSLVCEGRISVEDGVRVMRDPRYEIVPVGSAE